MRRQISPSKQAALPAPAFTSMARLSAVLVIFLGMAAFALPRSENPRHRVELGSATLDIPAHYVQFRQPWMAIAPGAFSSKDKAMLLIPALEIAGYVGDAGTSGKGLRVELATAHAEESSPSAWISGCSNFNIYEPALPSKVAHCENHIALAGIAISFTVGREQMRFVPAIGKFLESKVSAWRKRR